MSDKNDLDIWAFLANRGGHEVSRGIAKGLWQTNWLRTKAAENPFLARVVSEGLVALTSLLKLGGNHPVARLGEYLVETLATENLELLKEFAANPNDPELQAKVEAAAEATVPKAMASDVFVAFGNIHKDKQCMLVAEYVADTTPQPRTNPKDGKVITNPSGARIMPTTMASALGAGKVLCGVCYPATPVKEDGTQKSKVKEVVVGRNFMEYVMRLKNEEPDVYQQFWETYLTRLKGPDGPALADKWYEVCSKFPYEPFRHVAGLPSRNKEHQWEEWHHALDALLGKVTAPESMRKSLEGFIKDEKRQFEDMFLKLFAWIDETTEKSKVRTAEKKAANDKRDEEWKAFLKARKTRKLVGRLVFLGLLVILASWFAIQRVTDAPASPERSEQKVETSNVR